MRKVLVIAVREYLAAVRTKSFLISLIILPVMMGGSIVVQLLLKNQVDTREKRFAVVDRTPGEQLYPLLAEAAERRNQQAILTPRRTSRSNRFSPSSASSRVRTRRRRSTSSATTCRSRCGGANCSGSWRLVRKSSSRDGALPARPRPTRPFPWIRSRCKR